MWSLVQEEKESRKGMKQRYSGVHPLASKIICESCGSFYGLKSIRRSGVFYGMFWRCNHYYENECQSPNILEETIDDCFKLVVGDMFFRHEDVVRFCSKLLSKYSGADQNIIRFEHLYEWFVNKLDFVSIDGTTQRTLIKEIHPYRFVS